MKKQKLTRKELSKLFVRLRKEDEIFEDLVSERDKIIGVMEFHTISLDALNTELKKWDMQVEEMFKKLIDKKMKNLEKSERKLKRKEN